MNFSVIITAIYEKKKLYLILKIENPQSKSFSHSLSMLSLGSTSSSGRHTSTVSNRDSTRSYVNGVQLYEQVILNFYDKDNYLSCVKLGGHLSCPESRHGIMYGFTQKERVLSGS